MLQCLTGEPEMSLKKDRRQCNLATDYFSINTFMVPFAAAVLLNSVSINVQANIAAEARWINMGILFTNANYPHFTLNQYQEVCQKPAHKAMPEKKWTIWEGRKHCWKRMKGLLQTLLLFYHFFNSILKYRIVLQTLILTLYQTTNVRLCRWQNKATEKLNTAFGKSRKYCRKRRNCWSQAFSSFITVPFKGSLKS